jgi:hypothetical protein
MLQAQTTQSKGESVPSAEKRTVETKTQNKEKRKSDSSEESIFGSVEKKPERNTNTNTNTNNTNRNRNRSESSEFSELHERKISSDSSSESS